MKNYTVKGLAEMEALASAVLVDLQSGAVLLLYGELGAGKTTFTRLLALALGITADVTSPTFTIVGEYAVRNSALPAGRQGFFTTLVHADLYRFEGDSAATDPMITEMLAAAALPGRLTVIEWAERLGDLAIPGAIKMAFTHGTDEDIRMVDIGE
jgi:tRNA threonylcarbamoyladenosine biosynthesis protein TsaE